MTAVETPVGLSLPAHLRRASLLTWHELPRVTAVCALVLLAAVPMVVASLTSVWWLVAFSAIPVSLFATVLARVGAVIGRGERVRVRDVFTVDAPLALILLGCATLAERAISAGGALQIVGCVAAAVLLAVAPVSLAYGAVRGRRGVAALRGGLILVAYRPAAALTVLGVGVLAAFAVVATLGTLGLVLPAVLATFVATVVADLLATIDTTSDRGAGTP